VYNEGCTENSIECILKVVIECIMKVVLRIV
jgi:hypothetical protein